MGFLWYERRTFRDFVLVVEWKAASRDEDSGIFLRFPPPETPLDVENKGYEIQILDDWGTSGTGAIIWRGPDGYAVEDASRVSARAPGQWNQAEITVVGQQYTIVLNDEKVLEFTGNRGLEGHIGIQSCSQPTAIHFRTIRCKELPRSG
jgi:hypothetical protein